ncbi:MAG: hypothetical protein GXX95_11070 [Methanomassiliicoccus sp.]|nr:hypothetical protein [Methanomassiliicoccus sp.]
MMTLSERGMGKTDEENKEILENKILPSIDMLISMEEEGMLSGGFFGGQRSAAFVMSVEDEETLDDTVSQLPCSDIFDIETVPMESLKQARERDLEVLKTLSGRL